jgi:hypothetical protein
VFVVHGTKKFRDRVPGVPAADERSTTVLGNWYATVLFWRPQVALFVNERTLLPVLVPFAPSASVLSRFPAALASALVAHQVPRPFIEAEMAAMDEARLVKTTNRSVVGVMNEFAYLGSVYQEPDLLRLSLRLADTPCSPLYNSHGSPDRELAAFVEAQVTPRD